MIDSGRWAFTVTEAQPGQFHFTLLEAVQAEGGHLAFQPAVVDTRVHGTEIDAWHAAVSMWSTYLEDRVGPMRAAVPGTVKQPA